MNPFGSSSINGDRSDSGHWNILNFVFGGLGDFMKIEVDRHHLMIVGMGLIRQFLVEVLII